MRALEGIVVLDLSRRYPGAISAMFLGDFGAKVIKIDPPGLVSYHPDIDTNSEEFAAHIPVDRNKKSIILDLKTREGLEVFYKLVKKADVLVEGFRPGLMKRLKADYDTVKELNPGLIYCSLSGFGQDGPYAQMPGHDTNYCALGGSLSLIGQKDGPPCVVSNFLADVAGAGLHGTIGILMALMARERTGKGQYVDIAYLDGVISLLAYEATYYFLTGKVPRRGESHTTGGVSWLNVYKCKDGEYISIATWEPHLWENLCRALGREDIIPYQKLPVAEQGKAISALADVFLGKTRDEWFEFLKDKNTCIAPVYYLNETFSDPQVLQRKMVVEMEHPKLGKVRQIGIPIKLSETPGQIDSLGTQLGVHTDEVLAEIGYSPEDIESLRRAGALGKL